MSKRRWVLLGTLVVVGLALLALPFLLLVASVAIAPAPGLRLIGMEPWPSLTCDAAGCALNLSSTRTYEILPDQPAALEWCRWRLLEVSARRAAMRTAVIDVVWYEGVSVPLTEQVFAGPAVIVSATDVGCRSTIRTTQGYLVKLHFP